MRIAIFSDTFFPQINGIATAIYHSATAITELGHEVMLFIPAAQSKKDAINNSCDFKVVFCPSVPALIYPGERAALPFGIRAFKQLQKFKPDIVHSHTPFFVGWASVVAAKISRAKLVGTHHTFYDHYLKHVKMDYGWGRKFSWKYTVKYYNFCNLVLSPTESLAQALIHHGLRQQVKILPNPVDMNLFAPASKKDKNAFKKKFGIPGKSLVYMGRLSYEKNIDQAIKAFSFVLGKKPEIKLMIVGDGPERKNLENLCVQLGIKDSVIFTGVLRHKELSAALGANELFITSSKSENMPLAILEAMASGLPVVAVAEKGMNEIIQDGVNGFLSHSDDATAMSKRILQILQNSALMKEMSSASRALAEKYSRKNIAKSLEEIYKNLLGDNAK